MIFRYCFKKSNDGTITVNQVTHVAGEDNTWCYCRSVQYLHPSSTPFYVADGKWRIYYRKYHMSINGHYDRHVRLLERRNLCIFNWLAKFNWKEFFYYTYGTSLTWHNRLIQQGLPGLDGHCVPWEPSVLSGFSYKSRIPYPRFLLFNLEVELHREAKITKGSIE